MLLNISGGSTVVVGVKFDSLSNELLAWALVKAAEPGDCVIALHVVGNEENADQGGKASPLSLIKAFDSVLYACEGFCNLKQVDLKLKICRGLSVKKIIVREAISHSAAKVIVGTATKHHKIRSSTSVAKYCARKLPKTCSVLAVNNGKVSYQREGSEGSEDHRSSSLLNSIHRKMSFTKNCKVLCVGNALAASKSDIDHSNEKDSLQDSVKEGSYYREDVMEQNCSICGSVITAVDMEKSANVSSGDGGDDALAMVSVPKEEAASSSISTLIRQLPEVRPGWPLLRRAMTDRKVSDRSLTRQTSVVQWVMRLPSRRILCISDSDHRKDCSIHCENKYSSDDEESGAIVPVGTPSPDRCSQSLPEELVGVHDKYSATCRLFKYHELLSATSNFFAENLVGRGGSSEVYWGSLPDGKELAVKILKPSNNVLKEFILEIEIITTLHHKNIISLMGFCYEDTNLLLVYDFLSRGSLEENLYGIKKDQNAFGWNERYKVAVRVAEALDYLHSRKDKPVIHRDVKSSNILLSNDFEPQLSDFGLAKWASTSSTYITCTDVAGTFGYLAPEYFMYGKVNDKIDVYAYGVVLLELLSGRKPIENDYPKGQESLVMWAKPILNGGKVSQLLDPSLGNDYDLELIERMVLAATLCIRRAPRARPHMSLVLKLLQGDSDATKWARMQANASDGSDTLHNKAYPRTNLQSHLNIALRDLEDDSLSMSSVEQCVSLEDYLKGRWSRSSSFD